MNMLRLYYATDENHQYECSALLPEPLRKGSFKIYTEAAVESLRDKAGDVMVTITATDWVEEDWATKREPSALEKWANRQN